MAPMLSDEEKLLVRRAYDKLEISENRYMQVGTGFLNEKEQDILQREFQNTERAKVYLVGGYENADRRMLVFVPEYIELDQNELIGAIRCTYYKDYELSHRDFLGALMGLGIERETLGDIIINKDKCYADIIVKKELVAFLLQNFISAGRAKLKICEIPLKELEEMKIATEIITDTVQSPRIDAVVASGFGISRENASSLVKSGSVYLNRTLVTDPDKTVTDNSLINAVGRGKFKVFLTGNTSKKGRLFIKIEKYI